MSRSCISTGVSQVKLLGVTLSSDSSWNSHVDGIMSKAKRCMKTIFPGCSYDDILEMTNLPALGNRRSKCVVNNYFDPRQCDFLYARML